MSSMRTAPAAASTYTPLWVYGPKIVGATGVTEIYDTKSISSTILKSLRDFNVCLLVQWA